MDRSASIARYHPLSWPLIGFDNHKGYGRTRTKYSVRSLRYWFVASLLRRLHAELGRPIRVLEVGVGDGALLRFLGGPAHSDGTFALPDWIAAWDGLDVQVEKAVLDRFSYTTFIKCNIESPSELPPGPYDAVVLLHVLEHLFEPEAAMRRLRTRLGPDGALIGGSPTMPAALGALHERWLRRKYQPVWHDVTAHRHLSVISPGRLKRYAMTDTLSPEMISGAFFMRATNFFAENFAAWIRANLAWGATVPALGGEVYFCLRCSDA